MTTPLESINAQAHGPDFSLNIKELSQSMLSESLNAVLPRLQDLDKKIIGFLPSASKTSRQVIDHLFASGGKRIRPALYFFCTDLVNYKGEHLYPIGAVCEYVHTASLLHDDVVDSSTLRRNKPTANSIWGDQASVLVGDLIYSQASEMMAATGNLEIVKTFARAIRLMSEGELLQLEAVFNTEATIEHYLSIIHHKTAALIAASCRAAALLADETTERIDALFSFGENLGVAFQLVDDALDYLGCRELFGKATHSDLKEGKLTLPVLLLKDLINEKEKKMLENIILKSNLSSDDVAAVAKLVDKYGTADQTLEEAEKYTSAAIESLAVFPKSESRQNLEVLAQRLVWRFS